MVQSVHDATGNLIETIMRQLGELPAAPVVLSKALSLVSDLESHVADISRSIAADQTLAAKVVRMSNSPLYGRTKKITSLQDAITVLGYNEVKSIIITVSTAQMFLLGSQAAKISQVLWEHSLATALGARLIAAKFGGVNKEEAYLCGLLHDIGKLVMLRSAPDIYDRIVAKVRASNSQFHSVERQLLGFNHVQVAQLLLTKWRFPDNLVAAIAGHHSSAPHGPEPTTSLARVVAVADSIARYIGAGFFEAYRPETDSVCYVGDRLIDIDDLIELRGDTEAHLEEEMKSYCD